MNKKVIGCHQEQQELKETFHLKQADFIAIYGRRRVGKTYLIRHFFQAKICIYFQVIGLQNGTLEEQLENFTDSLSKTFYNNIALKTPASWKKAFEQLTTSIEKYIKKDKVILFFDELPWMTTPKSRLLEAFDYFRNKEWVNYKNLKLVICGSSASWILKKIIYNKGGLHNRVTRRIILEPFNLAETKLYLDSIGCHFNHEQVLEIYMSIGGIPFYLNNIKKNLSANLNINNLCFRKQGLLFDEFEKLFSSLFYESYTYIELIRLIAKKRYGISRQEIEKSIKLNKKGGTLTERLKNLEETGFILSFKSIHQKKRGLYYRVIDEYSLFYLTWIEPEKEILLKTDVKNNFWISKHNTPVWYNWSGYAFEAACYKHLYQIRHVLQIPDSSRSGIWKAKLSKNSKDKGAQIDLLFDRDDGVITLCEIKYTINPFVIDKEYARNLMNKQECFIKSTKTKKQIFFVMIAANGIKNNFYAEEIIKDVMQLNDFFEKGYILKY